MSFPRYPKYKDSGVEWLGQVPEHWRIGRLKYECDVFPSNVDKHSVEGEATVRLCNYTDVYYNDEITADLDLMQASASVDQIEKFTLRAGDTILTKDSETADDIAIGAFVPEDLPGVVCGYHLAIARPKNATQGAFIKRLFDSSYTKACCAVLATGLTRVGLGQNDLGNLEFAFPPSAEQKTIAAFLDRETAKIDTLVAEQERLIELLKEKRQAVISHAVTKGLNPNASMKDSGVEWLGQVPAHWTVAPVGSRYSIQLGKMLDSVKITGEHLRPYLRVADVQWGSINTDDLPEMDFDADDRARWGLIQGDLLVNEGGSYPGRSAIWSLPIECYYQKALHRARPRNAQADTTGFFFYVMRWAAESGVFVAGGNETTIEHLPAEKLRRYRFAFPPPDEQEEISRFLGERLSAFDALTASAEGATALLQERRATLISAAVTGQIDVRGTDTREVA